jgi:hypothetical protein
MEENKKDQKIINRESWFKIGIISFFCLLFGIPIFLKLLDPNLAINFSKINFDSLLTLIISIFAILLSAMFYFRTMQSSNDFYRDTFKFTKEISETLKGIEAGFGEKLKNIDKGYDDFRKSFENYMTPHEVEVVKKEVKEEKENLEDIVKQKDKIIKELEVKSNLSEKELKNYLDLINEKEQELEQKSSQLNTLKRKLENERNPKRNLQEDMRMYLKHRLSPISKKKEIDVNNPMAVIQIFLELKPGLDPAFLMDMTKLDMLTSDGNLTSSGIGFISEVIKDIQ